MAFEIFVRNDDVVSWSRPMFPKVNSDIEKLRKDGYDLQYLYDHVAIFQNGELIETLSKDSA